MVGDGPEEPLDEHADEPLEEEESQTNSEHTSHDYEF